MDNNKSQEIVNKLFGISDDDLMETAKDYVNKTMPTMSLGIYIETIVDALTESGVIKKERIEEIHAQTKEKTMKLLRKSVNEQIENMDKSKPFWEADAKIAAFTIEEFEKRINDMGGIKNEQK